MNRYVLWFLIIVMAGPYCRAQELLTAEQAVAIALQNNYNILLAKNNLSIEEQNKSLANAGILPSLNGVFTQNNSVMNSRQVRSDGAVQEQNNALNNSMSYGVRMDWTVFDGFRMFARYDQLKELERLGEAQLKLNVLTTAGDVLAAYYNLVQQQHLLDAYDTAIRLSEYRLQIAQNRFEIGKAAKLEVLNAQVDLNTDRTNLLRQKEQCEMTRIALNQLMVLSLDTNFKLMGVVEIDKGLTLDNLLLAAGRQNPAIQSALINQHIATYNLKQVKGDRYPQVSVNVGYNFNRSESSLGFARENTGHGLNYGISASVNIFNGFLQRRNERIAKIQVDNSRLIREQQQQSIEAQIMSVYQSYMTNIQLIEVETNNELLAKENMEITLEKFRIGSTTPLEVRTAQLNYINAVARTSIAKYQAKVSELQLKELTGNLAE